MPISINLGKTFLRKSCSRKIAVTCILARDFAYLPSFFSQILDVIYWMVLIFISIYFEWHDTEKHQWTKTLKWTILCWLTVWAVMPGNSLRRPMLGFMLVWTVNLLPLFERNIASHWTARRQLAIKDHERLIRYSLKSYSLEAVIH